jgi:hypothetical protein
LEEPAVCCIVISMSPKARPRKYGHNNFAEE